MYTKGSLTRLKKSKPRYGPSHFSLMSSLLLKNLSFNFYFPVTYMPLHLTPDLGAYFETASTVYSSPSSLQRPVALSVSQPEGWVTWDTAHPFEFVNLYASHASYISVTDSFFKTLDRSSVEIDSVYRVQNPHLWKDFTR